MHPINTVGRQLCAVHSLALMAGLACALPGIATAQEAPRILVSAKGTVKTEPDIAVITYDLRGEGTTSDDALKQLKVRSEATERAAYGFVGKPRKIETGTLSIRPVRGQNCNMSSYSPARLSQGECAILGYTAEVKVTLRTDKVEDAGTLAGLIGRNGALNPNVARFELSDPREAEREAMRRALADARQQGSLIATGSGMKLGPVQRIQDANYREISLEFEEREGSSPPAMNVAPPPPPPPPPVGVKLTPAAIETSVQIMVAYALVT
ncbi:SIMPL domain-containing protein [Novosphingobium sp. YJ-S2-02]|uniref:SIMPL domain-containing protein n=1 Tax=Novosphingobium aureum TaxID=2792964 RepID=A0A931HCX6_9SPHN|nr:SIMPL domain-containing protein [Novosphingobium aureum]MBH0113178.1 SIMPL domain-containing protein [Novosphingobium aureum]